MPFRPGPHGPNPSPFRPRPDRDNREDELRDRIDDLEEDLDEEQDRLEDSQEEVQRLTGYWTYGRVLHALLVQNGITPPPEPSGYLD